MVQADAVREIRGRSRSQTIAGIGLFAALALVLNIAHIQVPAPYLSFLIYEFWEIPIVVCLFIFGFYASLAASTINAVVLILVNPGALSLGPLYNLIAVIVTLLAIHVGHKFSTRAKLRISIEVAVTTGLAMIIRAVVMSYVNYFLLPFSPPLGFSTPDTYVVTIIPLIVFFNATLALYTVPLGYAGVTAAAQRLHFQLEEVIRESKIAVGR
jgi:riboflavin transporter FmnP